nr:retrovirus-related Pol polyprotein from transposon TNT 1-94 [Tanacetum cinerariifolium]
MTTSNVTSSTDSQMYNNIMAAGSRDCPPMLATGRYPQWRSRFLRYIDTRPNDATDDSLAIPEHTIVETPMNMSPENKAHFEAEKEAIHLILTGIGDEIYSTLDSCQTAQKIWEAIKRLQQGESLNIQDVKINLFWEFGKFTLHDGETMESYYSKFYKLMNEMIRNNLTVAIMKVNVQFLQQLQPEWSRFVSIVKQQHKLDEVSYHKLFDILKQYQKEVNELRAERLARNTNPLALVATAQANQDPYYQTSRSHKSHAPSSKPSIPTRSHTTTRHKVKEIAKPITPLSETASEEDSDPEQAQKDRDMQNNLALIAKYFKKIYKPTNNNLRTSSNSRNKNVDTTLRYKNDDHSGQFRNQRTVNVAGAKEKVRSPVVQQSGIQCFNFKEFGHFAKDSRKSKRVKDSAYHKEKMLLCKQADQGVQNDVRYNVFANDLQHSEQSESVSNTCLVETDDSNVIPDSPDMCEDDIQNDQNDVESDDERVALANLKLDVDENKKIQKQIKKANTTLAQELKECKAILAETMVKEKHDELIKLSLLTKSQYEGLVKQKTKVITNLKLREEHDIEKMLSMEKQLKFLNEIVYKRSQSIQTIHMMAPKVPTYNGRHTFANPRYLKHAQSEIPCLYAFPYDQSTHANRLIPDGEETIALEREKIVDNAWIKHSKDQFRAPTVQDMEILIQTCLMPLAIKTQNDSFRFVHELKQEMHVDLNYVESLEKEIDELESDKDAFSNMYDVILQELKECDCLAQKLSNQTDSVSKEVHSALLKRFAKVENIQFLLKSLCKNVKNGELKKLIKKGKGKSMDTKFDKPSVVRQPNAQRIPKPSVLGKPAPFSNYLERMYFSKTKSVPKANVSEGLSKPVTAQTLPQIARQVVSNTNVLKPGMYRINNMSTQTRAQQLLRTFRNTNPRVSTSTGVNHSTNVSKPQRKSNQLKDKVVPNNSQVKVKKTQVEVHLMIPSVSNKIKSVTACKDSLNSKILNANAVCATCNKCLVDSNHFACVTKMLNDVNARTKKPNVVPISTRKPKIHANKSIATSHKKKFALILGYEDLVQGNVTINRVYYVEGLNHNLFLVGQFCDADLEVAFRKSTCFVRDLQGNDLLTGNRGSYLYTISLQESTSSTPLYLMAKASPTQAWLWHRRLSHLNFDYINLLLKKDIVIGLPKLKYVKDKLCSSCELSKAKKLS